jgi:hypothetical protein
MEVEEILRMNIPLFYWHIMDYQIPEVEVVVEDFKVPHKVSHIQKEAETVGPVL